MDEYTSDIALPRRKQRSEHFLFFQMIAIAIALSLFVAGRFGFFDILGLKRIFEGLLFLPVVFIGFSFLIMMPRLWMSPFLLVPFSYFIFQLFWNPDMLVLSDLGISILITATILALGPQFADMLLRYTLNIATFFASLGIIEFIILLIKPSYVSNILLFYDYYSGSNVPLIQNAMQLLGLADGTSYHLWGLSVTRLRSFASEPSLLVGYFLVPGALGLTFRDDKYALYGLICILFCICSFAGSVYASLAFSMLSLLLLLNKKSNALPVVLPFVILVVFTWVLYFHFAELLYLTKSSGGGYDFLDKTNSANLRFSYIRDFIPKVVASPLGVSEALEQPLGLLLGAGAHSGIIGFSLTFIILIRLFRNIGFLLSQNLLQMQKMGLLLIYGALITGLLYLDNCFIQIYGFTLLLLINYRLEYMKLNLLFTPAKVSTTT